MLLGVGSLPTAGGYNRALARMVCIRKAITERFDSSPRYEAG
jgi:hypothetical protein